MATTVNAAPLLPILMKLFENSAANDQNAALLADQPIESSVWVDPDRTLKLQQQQQQLRQAKEAQPYLSRLADVQQAGMDNDPVWQQAAMDELTELQGYNAQKAPNNPLVQKGTQQARQGLQDVITTAGIADRVQRGDTVPGMDLARLAQQKDGNATIAKLIDLGKYNDDLRIKRGNQEWINASGDVATDPKLATLARAAQYGVTPDQFSTMAKIYGLDPVDLKTVQAGDAQGNDVQYLYHPRSGKTVGTVGMPQAAGRNASNVRVSVNPIIQQEGAFSKGVGEANAKQYASAIEAKQNAISGLQTLAELKAALKKAPAGITAPAQYQAGRVLAPNSESVTAYEVARNKQQELALNLLSNFKGAMSDKELKFVEEMSIRPTMNRQAQAELVRISEARYKKAINQANTLIKSVESDPVRSNINRTLSEGGTPKLTGQPPKTASDYLNKFRR